MDSGDAVSKSQYSCRIANLQLDKERIISIWGDAGLGTQEQLNHKIEWFYKSNPAGEGGAYLLCDEEHNKIIGVEGIGCRKWLLNGRISKVGLCVDFAVDKKYRALGPALFLLRNIKNKCLVDFDFHYGFPNKKAAPVFRRAGYSLLGNMIRYSKVLDSYDYLLQKYPTFIAKPLSVIVDIGLRTIDFIRFGGIGKSKSSWVEKFDKRVDELSIKTQEDELNIGYRSAEYLNWRYLGYPGQKYRIFFLEKASSNELLGFVVCFVDEINVMHVVDFLAEDFGGSLRRLMGLFIKTVAKEKRRAITVEFFGASNVVDILKYFGFHERHNRPIFFTQKKSMEDMIEIDHWYITAGDEDQ